VIIGRCAPPATAAAAGRRAEAIVSPGVAADHPIALVHDYLLVMRGAERTFAAMAEIWPDAPIHTLLYDEHGTQGRFAGRTVVTSPLQRTGVGQSGFRRLLPLMPVAASRLPVGGHELVVSSSSAFAHGVRAGAGAVHACYCHSPFRYAWHERRRALEETPASLRPALDATLRAIRAWDRRAARRATGYVANSEITRERIASFWKRDARVVHPPVAVERFRAGRPEAFLLVVGEVVGHKRTELALQAARAARRPITVVGTGPDLDRLREEHGGHARFLGRVDDTELAELYSRALALVVPGVEEFGIAAVEAQAAGRPVLGARAGGLLETVIPGTTGVLVPPDDLGALTAAMAGTDFTAFDPAAIQAQAARFSTERFQQRLREEVGRLTGRAC